MTVKPGSIVLFMVAASLYACSADARVFRSRPGDGAAGSGGHAASLAGAWSGFVAGSGGYAGIAGHAGAAGQAGIGGQAGIAAQPMFCTAGAGGVALSSAGAGAIAGAAAAGASAIAASNVPCETDADCLKTLFFPACDAATGLCTYCPNSNDEVLIGANVGLCFGLNYMRCCSDPNAASDCFIRTCAQACASR